MKVPKRLPESFTEALATAKRRGEVVLEVKMMRHYAGVWFEAAAASHYGFTTMACRLYIDINGIIREETNIHERKWDVIEKGLAVRDAQVRAWGMPGHDADWLKGAEENESAAV